MRLRRFLISDPMARTNLLGFAPTPRKRRPRRSLGRVADALDSQGLTGAAAHRESCRFVGSLARSSTSIPAAGSDSPTHPCAPVRAPVRDSARSRHRGSDPLSTRSDRPGVSFPHQLGLVFDLGHRDPVLPRRRRDARCAVHVDSISAAKTLNADSTSRTTPSGWRQAPRPSMIAQRSRSRVSTDVASGEPATSAARSSASAGSPKAHGPHWRELSFAIHRTTRCVSASPHASFGTTTRTPAPTRAPSGWSTSSQ